jgi:hypothetical protein
MTNTPCLDAYTNVLLRLRADAKRSARMAKPTMWAYYERMAERVEAHLEYAAAEVRDARARGVRGLELRSIDGGIAGIALAVMQQADDRCPSLPRDAAADLWALSVYMSRIHKAWGVGQYRRSLAWLRNRTGVQRLAAAKGGRR